MKETTIVTGGSHGIGRAIVERLAEEGQFVVNLDRVAPVDGTAGRHYQVDLLDPKATAETLQTVCAEYAVTRLVNNVGMVNPAAVEDVTVEDLERTISLNLRCPLQCVQAVLPAMTAAQFGRIVNISSRASLGRECRTSYAATKGGINTITRTWALEVASRGITVNAVAPGVIDTDLHRAASDPGDPITQKMKGSIALGRLGEPEEVAQAVAFFLDRRSSYITGQLLFACGGLSIGGIVAV